MSNSFAFTCEQLDVAQWLPEYNSYMFPQADGTLEIHYDFVWTALTWTEETEQPTTSDSRHCPEWSREDTSSCTSVSTTRHT